MHSKQVSRKFFHPVDQLADSRLGRRCHRLFLSFSHTSIGYYCIRMTSLFTGLTFYLLRRVGGLWPRIAGSGRAMSSSGETKHDDEIDNTKIDDNGTRIVNCSASDSNIRAASTSPETEASRHRLGVSAMVLEESQVISSEYVSVTENGSTTPVSSDESLMVANTKQSSALGHIESKRTLDKESVASRDVQPQQASLFSLWSNPTKDCSHKTREQVVKDEKGKCYRQQPFTIFHRNQLYL